MEPDRFAKLSALSERLLDVFLQVADPDNMSGGKKKPADLTKEERGNLAWDVKTANSFGLLAARSLELTAREKWRAEGMTKEVNGGGELGTVIDTEAEIQRFEAEARKALERASSRVGK